ncbi:DUF5682 family protein [Actinomyces dentalis]|uniref:DUF5682 family protein n=1 Tax=Actinomyces dentalis TaxID=272548 RepID=UPI0003FB5343|nr:DUF5682 family protein [Actinomyces dentalis]
MRTAGPRAGRGAAGPSSAPGSPVPPGLARALEAQRAWGRRGVHLVPIRHHSPACALALSALLEEVRPAVVLIEGPAEYTALLGALQDAATVPPVAVLSLGEGAASYYPLAEFSPEWVALRWAGANGAEAAFIDRGARPGDDDGAGAGAGGRTLQAEYHLARSAALDALASRLGCRDHDEVWEQLFEDRATADIRDWRGFFADTLAWSGLARLDAEPEVLDADGTRAREAVMAAAVLERLPDAKTDGTGDAPDGQSGNAPDAPIVVVTGAFHTPALLDVLDSAPGAARPPEPDPRPGAGGWLIRYDFARLDSLRGYGAGMPSPGLWRRAWRARTRPGTDGRDFATGVVLDVAAALRGLGEPLGTAQVEAAVEQALGLAELRGRAWPGRTDLLDALRSCLVKDDAGLSGNLGAAVASVFAHSSPGEVPASTCAPPLVAEVRERLAAMRFMLDDALEHRTALDTARKPRHRERRELLAAMRFVGSGFAWQTGGADLVAGTGAGQFVEEWAYAWTPAVEAELVRAAERAPTLDILIRVRLAERLEAEPGAEALAALLTELIVMGEHELAGPVCDALETALADLSGLGALAEVLHRLMDLVEGAGRLSLGGAAKRLRAMVRRGVAGLAELVAEAAGLEDDEAADAVDALISVRDLLVRLDGGAAAPNGGADPDGADNGADPDAGRRAVAREVDVLRRRRDAAPILVGCATGIAASIGSLSRAGVTAAVVAHLSAGADPGRLADFLVGLVRACPDLVLHAPDTLEAVTRVLTGLDEPGFLAILPDLRRAFTALRPTETHRLAEQVAALTGARASQIDVVWRIDPQWAEAGRRLEADLVAGLVRDGLGQWTGSAGGGPADHPGARRAGAAGGRMSATTPPQPDRRAPSDREGDPPPLDAEKAVRRWRMVLGRYAESALPRRDDDAGLDETLGYLYDREYTGRGLRHGRGVGSGGAGPGGVGSGGGLGASALRAVDWLDGARRLFPASTLQRLESDALTRYGLTELLADPSAVDSIETSPELGAALLRIKGTICPQLADGLRALIARIVADAVERLRRPLTTALTGSRRRDRRSPRASARDFDWRRTIAANLGNADPVTGRLLVQDVRFMSRRRRQNLQWDVIILVDQSASMASSLLHSAVMASILAALPGLSVRLILFDTSVVDVSHLAGDPVEVLMTCQLGGGTDIARAVAYASGLVRRPTRTVVALVSDFEEGGSVSSLVGEVAALAGSGVRLLGLAALNGDGEPWYDRVVAERLAGAGMRVAAMTPDRFAVWLAEVT